MKTSQDHVYTLNDGKQVLVIRMDSLHGMVYYLPKLPGGFNLTRIPQKLSMKDFQLRIQQDLGASNPKDLVW